MANLVNVTGKAMVWARYWAREGPRSVGIRSPSSKFEPTDLTDLITILARRGSGLKQLTFQKDEIISAQGQPADYVFYIHRGKVAKTRLSVTGKTRVVSVLGPQEFFGLRSIIDAKESPLTASAMTNCIISRIDKEAMVTALRELPELAERFISFLIERSRHYEVDLMAHLIDSSEQRLARTLLSLSDANNIVPKISQEKLAEIVGTTRSRINYFMNKFHKLGLIEKGENVRVLPGLSDVYEHLE